MSPQYTMRQQHLAFTKVVKNAPPYTHCVKIFSFLQHSINQNWNSGTQGDNDMFSLSEIRARLIKSVVFMSSRYFSFKPYAKTHYVLWICARYEGGIIYYCLHIHVSFMHCKSSRLVCESQDIGEKVWKKRIRSGFFFFFEGHCVLLFLFMLLRKGVIALFCMCILY